MVYRGLYSYRQRVRVITCFPNLFFSYCFCILSEFVIVLKGKSDAYKHLIVIMQHVCKSESVVLVVKTNIYFVIFDIVVKKKKQIGYGLAFKCCASRESATN